MSGPADRSDGGADRGADRDGGPRTDRGTGWQGGPRTDRGTGWQGGPRTDRGADPHGGGRGEGRRADEPQAGPGAVPVLTVVRGDPSAEEIAALAVVLAAKSAGRAAEASPADGPAAAARSRQLTGWASRPAMLRRPLRHGTGAWRASARPGFWT